MTGSVAAITGTGVDSLTRGIAELLPARAGDPAAPLDGTVFKIERGAAAGTMTLRPNAADEFQAAEPPEGYPEVHEEIGNLNGELLARLVEVIEIKVRVAEGVHELAGFESGHLRHQQVADHGRVRHRLGPHIGNDRNHRSRNRHACQRLRHHLCRGLHQRAVERRAYRQKDGPFCALLLGNRQSPLHRALMARNHNLRRVIVIGRLTHFSLRRFFRHSRGLIELKSE